MLKNLDEIEYKILQSILKPTRHYESDSGIVYFYSRSLIKV